MSLCYTAMRRLISRSMRRGKNRETQHRERDKDRRERKKKLGEDDGAEGWRLRGERAGKREWAEKED